MVYSMLKKYPFRSKSHSVFQDHQRSKMASPWPSLRSRLGTPLFRRNIYAVTCSHHDNYHNLGPVFTNVALFTLPKNCLTRNMDPGVVLAAGVRAGDYSFKWIAAAKRAQAFRNPCLFEPVRWTIAEGLPSSLVTGIAFGSLRGRATHLWKMMLDPLERLKLDDFVQNADRDFSCVSFAGLNSEYGRLHPHWLQPPRKQLRPCQPT